MIVATKVEAWKGELTADALYASERDADIGDIVHAMTVLNDYLRSGNHGMSARAFLEDSDSRVWEARNAATLLAKLGAKGGTLKGARTAP